MVSVTVLGARSLFRAALVDLLGGLGFAPIEQADHTGELMRLAGEAQDADRVITALARGAGEITRTVQEVRSFLPSAKIVCLVPAFDLDEMRDCFAAGASGYVLESISREALSESLRLVDVGEKVFPSELALQLEGLKVRREVGREAAHAPAAALSSREVEILQCLANGESNKVIAKNLGIAEATVKVHLKRILRKANAANRTQAALWAIARGLAARRVPEAYGADGPAAGTEPQPASSVGAEPRSFRPLDRAGARTVSLLSEEL
jgi:two-component system nitrate/nitrite response regulator NarL